MDTMRNAYVYWIGLTTEGEPDFVDTNEQSAVAVLYRTRAGARARYPNVRKVIIKPFCKSMGYAFQTTITRI